MPNVAAAERPATFREVLANREFRAVFAGSGLSWFGDHAARAAVTMLVFQRTESVGTSAAAFAISYLPWLGIGSILTALVERQSYRRVMIVCDVLRLITMALVAIPGLPVSSLIGLLFLTALLNPPFDAARSALLPLLLPGDQYVVGLTAQKTVGQATRIFGYVCGASLAAFDARLAVGFNAATFGISALAVAMGVRERPPALAVERRSGILRETGEGFSFVFRARLLRAIALLMFAIGFFTVLPEGLAAGWAAHLTDVPRTRGWYQGLIMIAHPIGFVLGGLIVGRFTSPVRRLRLLRPFAVLSPAVLLPALFDPGIVTVTLITGCCGFLSAGLVPASNSLFVQALPNEYRARAFGVVQSGLQVVQGAAVFLGGALADQIPLYVVVGANAVLGTGVLVAVIGAFPSAQQINETILATRTVNEAATDLATRTVNESATDRSAWRQSSRDARDAAAGPPR